MAGGTSRQLRNVLQKHWPSIALLMFIVVLFKKQTDIQGQQNELSARIASGAERERRSMVQQIQPQPVVVAPQNTSPQQTPNSAIPSSAMGQGSSTMGQSNMGMVNMGPASQGMGSTMGQSNKAPYEWPKPLPEWELVPEAEADVSALPGEGEVPPEIKAIERKGDGVLFNAIHRTPNAKRASKPIMEAIVGATRMRVASKEAGSQNPLGFVLVTERAPMKFMMDETLCRPMWPECIDFKDKVKVFDTILFYEDFKAPAIVERRERFQTWPELWLKRIMASLHSPFARTLVVDSDVYGCTAYEKLFTEYLGDSDVAITLAPAPFGASRNYEGAFRKGFPTTYAEYTERNLGLHMLATGKPRVQALLSLFRDVFVRQANDTVHTSIGNDQCAFREAMFTMKAQGLTEVTIPAEIGCRHDAGCADGCYVVHRHNNQELSRAELKALAKEKNAQKKAAKAAAEGKASAPETMPPKNIESNATDVANSGADTAPDAPDMDKEEEEEEAAEAAAEKAEEADMKSEAGKSEP